MSERHFIAVAAFCATGLSITVAAIYAFSGYPLFAVPCVLSGVSAALFGICALGRPA